MELLCSNVAIDEFRLQYNDQPFEGVVVYLKDEIPSGN